MTKTEYARYSIAAIPTTYAGVNFRSRLEARYAAFFDIVGWKWGYEPLDLKGWIPDFYVSMPHEYNEFKFELLAEVKPYRSIADFRGTPEYSLAMEDCAVHSSPCDAVGLFGIDPSVSYWDLGGISRSIPTVFAGWKVAWRNAGNTVQWRSKGSRVIGNFLNDTQRN